MKKKLKIKEVDPSVLSHVVKSMKNEITALIYIPNRIPVNGAFPSQTSLSDYLISLTKILMSLNL